MNKRGLISVFDLFLLGQKESGACVKFLSWEKRSSVLSQPTSGPVFFIANFHVCVEEIFVLLISQTVNGEVVYFVLGSFLFCHIENNAFTITIQDRFGNSIDQSERA